MRGAVARSRASIFSQAELKRKGDTEKRWYRETDIVVGGVEKSSVELYFETRSAGPGMSNLHLLINSADFPNLLALMTQADQNAAIKAMVEELRYQVCEDAEDPKKKRQAK